HVEEELIAHPPAVGMPPVWLVEGRKDVVRAKGAQARPALGQDAVLRNQAIIVVAPATGPRDQVRDLIEGERLIVDSGDSENPVEDQQASNQTEVQKTSELLPPASHERCFLPGRPGQTESDEEFRRVAVSLARAFSLKC